MENTRICYVVGAMSLSHDMCPHPAPGDYVIAADRGYDALMAYGVRPDLVVGDFDSLGHSPTHPNVKVLPVQKDETDTMSAAMVGFKLGYTSFVLVGCLGGDRFDHSVANLNVLLYITNRGGNGVICTEDTKIFVMRTGRVVFTDLKDATISVFPFDGPSCNMTYEGLEYPLFQKNLIAGDTLMGVSNRIVEDRAEVRVNFGCALIILYTPKTEP